MPPADVGIEGIKPTPARPVLAFVFLALGISLALTTGNPVSPLLPLTLAVALAADPTAAGTSLSL